MQPRNLFDKLFANIKLCERHKNEREINRKEGMTRSNIMENFHHLHHADAFVDEKLPVDLAVDVS